MSDLFPSIRRDFGASTENIIYNRCVLPLLLLLRFSFAHNVSICQYDTKKNIIVVALLSLYDEASGCSKLTLRGLQQITLLEKVVADINRKDATDEGMSMVLHVVNTCSLQDDGVSAALKSLVISQQTCVNPPLLIGFIGPENYRQFQEVNKMTAAFKKFHILPFAPTVKRSKEENSVMYVGNGRFQLRSKIILAVMNQLQWRAIYAVVGDNVALNGLLEYLLNEIDRICITGVSKIPKDQSALKGFFETVVAEFQESGADGIMISVDDPAHIRPILNTMNEWSIEGTTKIPFIFYINRVGLKSWELPRNYRILLLQETSELSGGANFVNFYNKTLWRNYSLENGLDYQKDLFEDLLDSTIVPLEFGLNLLWNAAKYARKIKCNLGNTLSEGVCSNLLRINPTEWKTFMHKASYYDQSSLRKISFEMNVPVTVKVFYHEVSFVSPLLIGRITEIGIMDLKMSLQSAIPTGSIISPRRCMFTPTKVEDVPVPTTIDHNTNWLAIMAKKMKNLFQLEGLVSTEANERINTAVIWIVGMVVFLFGLILITKCVYTVFRVESDEERRDNRRRKNRIMSS